MISFASGYVNSTTPYGMTPPSQTASSLAPNTASPNEPSLQKFQSPTGCSPQFALFFKKARAYWTHETALLMHKLKKAESAERNYQKALRLYSAACGGEHPHTAGVLYNLGDLYHDLERYPEAIANYLQAYEIERKALGNSHPRTIKTMQNIAAYYHDTGQARQAEGFYKKIIESQSLEVALGQPASSKNLSALATTEGDLAALLHEQQSPLIAKQYYTMAINHFQQGKNASETERMRQNLTQLEQENPGLASSVA